MIENYNELQRFLDSEPPVTDSQKIGRQSFKYIPVSQIEADLDLAFGPFNWQLEMEPITSWGIVGEAKDGSPLVAIQCTVHLILSWQDKTIRRTGAASTYASKNIIKTVSSAVKSFAFKNACKSLGRRFGRDLNRDFEADSYGLDLAADALNKIAEASNIDELKDAVQGHDSKYTRQAANKRAKELKLLKSKNE